MYIYSCITIYIYYFYLHFKQIQVFVFFASVIYIILTFLLHLINKIVFITMYIIEIYKYII